MAPLAPSLARGVAVGFSYTFSHPRMPPQPLKIVYYLISAPKAGQYVYRVGEHVLARLLLSSDARAAVLHRRVQPSPPMAHRHCLFHVYFVFNLAKFSLLSSYTGIFIIATLFGHFHLPLKGWWLHSTLNSTYPTFNLTSHCFYFIYLLFFLS